MALTITIGGTTTVIDEGSLSIVTVANGIDRMTCTVTSIDGSIRPAMDAAVVVSLDGTVIFGGLLDKPTERGFDGLGLTPITTEVDALDYNALTERRVVSATIPAGTLKAALVFLTTYLSSYGVTLDAAQVNGPSLPELVFEDVALTDVFARIEGLCVSSGVAYVRNISYTKVLGMYLVGTVSAPWNIADGDGHIDGDLSLTPSREGYANRVLTKFMEAARTAYAFLAASGNFSHAETVTVGGQTYTFQTVLTDVNGYVLIGATAAASLNNLIAAITLGAGAGTLYASSTTLNGSVTAYVQTATLMKALALAVGASGNAITCTHTCVLADWVGEGSIPRVTLGYGADAALSNRTQSPAVSAEPTAEQTAHGLREVVVSAPDCYTLAAAQAVGDAELVRRVAATARIAQYATYDDGLRKGQTQTITKPTRHINASFVITDVRARDRFSKIYYEIRAVEGMTPQGSFRDTYQQWSGSASAGGTLISGAVAPVTVLPVPHYLGGTMQASLPVGTTYTRVLDGGTTPFIARGTFTGIVRATVKARAAAVGVQPCLRCVTDYPAAGSEQTGASVVTGAGVEVEQTFPVSIVTGKRYELYFKTNTAGASGYAAGQLETS